MGTLTIQLLGAFRIKRDARVENIRVIPTVQSLLAFLVIHPDRVFSRDVIAEQLWGERSDVKAHNCLNTAFWRLRQALEPQGTCRGTYLISRLDDEIGFNAESDFWLDLREFEKGARAILSLPVEKISPQDAQQAERALQLYAGDFMQNCSDSWVLLERERLRGLYLRSLSQLLTYSRLVRQPDQALAYGEKILEIDPLREEIHRELMRIYAETGRRSLAVRQYEICRTSLMKELGLPPMLETRQLHGRIIGEEPHPSVLSGFPARRGTPGRPPAGSSPAEAQALQSALERLSAALNRLEETRQEIQEIYALLNDFRHPS